MFDKVDHKAVRSTASLYQEQVPVFWNEGMAQDSTLIQALSIGYRHGIDYLRWVSFFVPNFIIHTFDGYFWFVECVTVHLCDDFNRSRVTALIDEGEEYALTVVDWANPKPKEHHHFAKLKKIKILCWDHEEDISEANGKPIAYRPFVEQYVSSKNLKLFVKLLTFPVKMLGFSVKMLRFSVKLLWFLVKMLWFLAKMLWVLVKMLWFLVKTLCFLVKMLWFLVEILWISVKILWISVKMLGISVKMLWFLVKMLTF